MIEIQGIKFYTIADLKEMLKISELTIGRYIKRGKIPAQRIGRNYLISETALNEYLTQPERQARKTTAQEKQREEM